MLKKVILDTNVLISALVFDKIPEQALVRCLQSDCEIYFSTQTDREWKTKIYSGRLSQILTKSKRELSSEQIDIFVDLLERSSQIIEVDLKLKIARDPKDNMFLELAKAVSADYLISGDKDLLEIKEFENTKILRPSEFLMSLG
jgi:putative PIN family toxin of toxin-antitoxin system